MLRWVVLDFGIVMDVVMDCVGFWDCDGLRLVGGGCRGDSVRSWIEFEEVVAMTVFLCDCIFNGGSGETEGEAVERGGAEGGNCCAVGFCGVAFVGCPVVAGVFECKAIH